MIHIGMGSTNAATIMDLLSARSPKGVLLLSKCGGQPKITEAGHHLRKPVPQRSMEST